MTKLLMNRVLRFVRVLIAVLVTLAGLWGMSFSSERPVNAQSTDIDTNVVLIRLNGAIDGVSARFVDRGLDTAVEQDAQLVVVILDTPGGLLDATRGIVASILASEVPVAVYVAPEGARATSAGVFIGASADVLAMAPATNIGAAAVVQSDGSDLPETLSQKASQDTAAFIRSIAERRDRNVSALEDTVLSAAAYSALEAVELGIVDLIAVDYASLLHELDGYTVESESKTIILDLGNVTTNTVDLTLLERVLSFISNPDIAFLLISLGGLGVIVELWNPGLWVPGTLGVLFLIVGWAGVGQLPFSWAGVALIVLSLLLFYLELLHPGIGYFGIAGTISLILGGIILVGFFGSPGIPWDSPTISLWLLATVGAVAAGLILWVVLEIHKSRRIRLYQSPIVSVSLVGATGVVSSDLSPLGEVLVNGEFWSGEAESGTARTISAGANIEVVSVYGNHLKVKPVQNDSSLSEVSDNE